MIAVIIFLLAAIALIIGIGVAGNSGMTVTTAYSVGLIGESGILGCTFPPDVKQTNDIQWEKVGLNGIVYKYTNGKADLAGQNAEYKSRASLFLNQLVTGNASLKLNNVKLSDAGLYKCSISNTNGKGSAQLDFKVGSFNTLTVTNITLDTLRCESPAWYPKPSVSWLNSSSGETLTNQTSTSFLPGLNSMVQVRSDLIKTAAGAQYTCVIQNELAQATGEVIITDAGVVSQTRLNVFSSSDTLSSSMLLFCILSWFLHCGGFWS